MRPHGRRAPRRAWVVILAIGAMHGVQPAIAVGQADPGAPVQPPACSEGEASDEVYFVADDGVHSRELWATDGTSRGTRMVKDVNPDGSSDPQLIGVMGGVLIFFADDGIHGREPWRSDGTPQGTWLIADLQTSQRGSATNRPQPSFVLGDRILFPARAPGGDSVVWSTDGTTEGTERLEGLPFAGPKARADGWLHVWAEDDAGRRAVWRTDGTAARTERLPGPGPLLVHVDPVSARAHVVSTGGYSVERGHVSGWQAWFGEGLPDVGPRFTYDDAFEGPGLMPVTVLGDTLLFYADAGDGFSLWASDGTAAGTGPIGPIGPRGTAGLYDMPEPIAIISDRALLLAQEEGHGPALWVLDGTADGTRRLADLRWADRERLSWVAPVGSDDRVYFEARSDRYGRQVWVTDGTVNGTRRLTSLPRGSRPVDLTVGDGRVHIGVVTSKRRAQVWASDGTRRRTRLLQELPPQPVSWTTPVFLDGTARGALLIRPLRPLRPRPTRGPGDPDTAAFGLATSDGTRRGTRHVRGVELHVPAQGPEEQAWQMGALAELFAPLAVDGLVYFRNPDPAEPERFAGLWRSDGTPAGTERVSPIVPSAFLAAIGSDAACAPHPTG